MISLELTNYCNIKCSYCFIHQEKRPKGHIHFDLFKNIIDEMYDLKIRRLRLVGVGEPTIHPKFKQLIEYASEYIPNLEIKTNAHALSHEICECLLKNFGRINVSVEGYLPEHIESGRVGISYDQLRQNLIRLNTMRRELNSKSVINLNVMYRPSMQSKRKEIVKFWRKYGDFVLMHELRYVENNQEDPDLFRYPVKGDDFIRCGMPFTHLAIGYEGLISYCMMLPNTLDDDAKYIGNVGDIGIAEAWNHPRMVNLRKAHRTNDSSLAPLCKGCPSSYANCG